jgi:exonuclease SbcC
MNAIKSIRLKNFESHEDTLIDDLSPGLNAFVGDSNSGKSAIVRALNLIAYNEFDPKSVRIGCDNCEVEVTTDNGKVKVTRGKKNLWEVTDRTGKTSYFDKIGKQILPEVSAILGFGMVKLGDIEMKANIMDQLEAHFMLSEFSGQDATGSLRAQVVDEISGLSGVETLIRDVSLDNSRLTREVNQIEERNREIEGQMHNLAVLNKEQAVVTKAKDQLAKYDEDVEAVGLLRELIANTKAETDAIAAISADLTALPDDRQAMAMLGSAEGFLNDAQAMQKMRAEVDTVTGRVKAISADLKALPDEKRALAFADATDATMVRLKGTTALHEQLKKGQDELHRIWKDMQALPDVQQALAKLALAEASKTSADERRVFYVQYDRLLSEAEELRAELEGAIDDHKAAAAEYNALLATIDVCPVTMKPIGAACMKGGEMAT